jgi:uncharacterized protein YqhQ
MRTPDRWAIAVRRPDGAIHTESHRIDGFLQRHPLVRRSLIRGPFALAEAMGVGVSAVRVAVRVGTGAEIDRRQVGSALGALAASFLVLFVAGPQIAVGLAGVHGFAADFFEGFVRLDMLLVYLLLVSRSRDAAKLYRYHGAEHKTIAAFERLGRMPGFEDVRTTSPIHSRCGTNFAVMFMICAGLVYSVVPIEPLWTGALYRVLLVPVVGAIAYEIMRVAALQEGELWSRIVVWPGRTTQRLTAREPDDSQIEVALAALEALLQPGL